MSKLTQSLLSIAASGLIFAVSAAAQTATTNTAATTTPTAGPGVHNPGHPRVNQVNRREGRQQKRIAKGVQNGTLTNKQASHLETRETALQNREQADMNKHNGHMTKGEQHRLNHRENRISRSIRRDKTVTTEKNNEQK